MTEERRRIFYDLVFSTLVSTFSRFWVNQNPCGARWAGDFD